LRIHVRILNVKVGYRYIVRGAPETARPSTGRLRRERQARVTHGVFPGHPGALAAIRSEVSFRALREAAFPTGLEVGPRQIEA
jgi:hypothetical protein